MKTEKSIEMAHNLEVKPQEFKDFAQCVNTNQQAQEHAQEIQKTRVGGLGGSDAAIVYKIGTQGMAALTATDHKRLAVMVGKIEPDNWSGNEYTNAGHLFEDYADAFIPFGSCKYEREAYMQNALARNYKTFAHADFLFDDTVVECKFVQSSTGKTAEKYMPQLQWYYLLGAKKVILLHGTGSVDPFAVSECTLREIERDEQFINALLAGIKTLDDALQKGWTPEVQDKVMLQDTPAVIQRAFETMASIRLQEERLKNQKEEAIAIIKSYLEGFGLTGIIKSGDVKQQVIYTSGKISKTFDLKKFLADHPKMNVDKYYKITKSGSSITFK